VDDERAPDEGDPPPRSGTGTAGLAARLRALVDTTGHLVEEARRRSPVVDAGLAALDRDREIGGFVLAGALAFRLFVFALPLYLLVLVVMGAAFAVDPDQADELARSAGLAPTVADALADAASTSSRSLWILVPVTLWGLVVASRSVHKVLAASHLRAWQMPPARQSTVGAGGVLGVTFVMVVAMAVFGRFHEGLWTLVTVVVAALFYTGLWWVASLLLAHPAGVSAISLLPGAVIVGIGTQGLFAFNVLYLDRRIESASEAYGALGIAASGLLWLYLLGRLLVAAPVVNAVLHERGHLVPGLVRLRR
jgi:uncharacterized BrkB/YihY/UPF0761 family membrane protein